MTSNLPHEIDATTTVAILLERWPQLRLAFQERGMTCPGCAMARFDALGYVAEVYGLRIEPWLRELRRGAVASRLPRRPHHATH